MTHRLKIWPSEWRAVQSGKKSYEVRLFDRDFAVGDCIELDEWDPEKGQTYPLYGYTGRVLTATIAHITYGGRWGLPSNLCVFSFTDVAEMWRSGDSLQPMLRCEQGSVG